MRRLVLRALTASYALAVAWITLNPFPPDPHRDWLLRALLRACAATPALAWIDFGVVEFTANILLFVPAGALGMLLLGRWRWWLTFVLGVAATLTIEFVQLFLPERYSDARDLLANTLGTLAGIAIVALVDAVAGPRRRAGRSASASASASAPAS